MNTQKKELIENADTSRLNFTTWRFKKGESINKCYPFLDQEPKYEKDFHGFYYQDIIFTRDLSFIPEIDPEMVSSVLSKMSKNGTCDDFKEVAEYQDISVQIYIKNDKLIFNFRINDNTNQIKDVMIRRARTLKSIIERSDDRIIKFMIDLLNVTEFQKQFMSAYEKVEQYRIERLHDMKRIIENKELSLHPSCIKEVNAYFGTNF